MRSGLEVGSCAHSHGRGAETWRPALTGVVSLLALLVGCAAGGEVEGAAIRPRAELAQVAEVAAENQPDRAPGRPRANPGGPASRGGSGSGGRQAGAADPSASTTGPGRPETSGVRTWDELAAIDDPTGDHGNGPSYADLSRIALRERGADLAVGVTLAGVVPPRLADREVQGVGIDIFRSRSGESDYQVFLEGGRHGWRAFLRTPDGFVEFPGSFTVRHRALRVVVPWSSLGGRADVEVSVFSDWSSGVGRLSADGTPRVPVAPG